MNLMSFYGHVKFATAPAEHGLQVGHAMMLAQWQKNKSGKLTKEVVWPPVAQTEPLIFAANR